MRLKLSVIALACFISQASATIIELEFTGLVTGIRPVHINGVYNIGSFDNKPFTAEFTFNTDNGTLQTIDPGNYGCVVTCYRLSGGLVSAFIDLDNLGTWGGNDLYFNGVQSFLIWQDDLSYIAADAGINYNQISMHTNNIGNRYGSFQFGLCPTTIGGPCGFATSIELTAFSVPAPVVGTGLPGLLLAGILLIWRHFRPVESL